MNKPSKSLYKRTLSESLQVSVKILTGSRRFSMLPEDLLSAKNLPPIAKLLAQGMWMDSFGADVVAVSHQALALICGVSRPAVFENLKVLVKFGVIERAGKKIGQIQPYRFLHPFYQNKSHVAEEIPVRTVRHKGPMRKCANCFNLRYGLMKTGWCRTCVNEVKLVKKMDRRIETKGREVAREEIQKAVS